MSQFNTTQGLQNHLGLVPLAASGTVVGSFIRVCPHVLTYMPNGFVQLATLTTLVPPLTDMDLHVFLEQVTSEKLLVAECALEWFVTCMKREDKQKINPLCMHQQKIVVFFLHVNGLTLSTDV